MPYFAMLKSTLFYLFTVCIALLLVHCKWRVHRH